MNRQQHDYLKFMIIPAVAFLLLAGCAQLSAPEGSATVRDKLTRLQANQELAN